MIGNSYGSLVVIGFDRDADTVIVKCKCNNVEGYLSSALISGEIKQCRRCNRRTSFIESITQELMQKSKSGLKTERAKKIVMALVKHLDERWINERSASFLNFVDGLMNDNAPEEPAKIEQNICRSITSSIRRSGKQSAADFVSKEPAIIVSGAEQQTMNPIR